jgi:hypothetical protein
MQFWDKERVQLACMVEGEIGCAFRGVEIIEAAPINDPVAGQDRNWQGPSGWVWSKITDDLA